MIQIGGFTRLTTLDYPGHLSAVVFCQGCLWKCRFCHNPHLQSFIEGEIAWSEILTFLEKRKNVLDAVVFSGGEPIMQRELPEVIKEVCQLGYKIALHTGGASPPHFEKILPLIDWVGMDIKAPFENYEKITQVPKSGEKIRVSAKLLIDSGVDYEFRTTVHHALLSVEEIKTIAKTLHKMGAKRYILQTFHPEGCIDRELLSQAKGIHVDDHLREEIDSFFAEFSIRE